MFYSLPVMMYHSISRLPSRMAVSPELFEKHCHILAKNGWRGISLAEAEDHYLHGAKLPAKSCLFTFDDGYLDNYVYAEPILRAYGHCGVIFPILDLLEKREELSPNRDDLAKNPEREAELTGVHSAKRVNRAGFSVQGIRFCSCNEIRHMQARGTLAAVPHSLAHDRVLSEMHFTRLHTPPGRSTFFAASPCKLPWGFPLFTTHHALSTRGFTLNPELFDVVNSIVPQEEKQAKAFLSNSTNREMLCSAIAALPWVGNQETEKEFRERIFTTMQTCRKRFAEHFGITPVSFCWPWGSFCQESIEEAERAGFQVLFCTSETHGLYKQAVPVKRFGVRYYTTPEILLRKMLLFSLPGIHPVYSKLVRAWQWSKTAGKYIASRGKPKT